MKIGSGLYACLADTIRVDADLLQQEPVSLRRAGIARAAFLSASDAVRAKQQLDYPYLERAVTELHDAARALQPDRPLLEQEAEVQEFFQSATDALRGMTRLQP